MEDIRDIANGLEVHGIKPDRRLTVFAESFSESEGYRCARKLLASRRAITGIVAADDLLALGVLRALAFEGLTCPDDISVVGFNDMPFMDRITPALTTIRLPHYEVGAASAELLTERIADPTRVVKVVFLPPELVVRSSTAGPSSARA